MLRLHTTRHQLRTRSVLQSIYVGLITWMRIRPSVHMFVVGTQSISHIIFLLCLSGDMSTGLRCRPCSSYPSVILLVCLLSQLSSLISPTLPVLFRLLWLIPFHPILSHAMPCSQVSWIEISGSWTREKKRHKSRNADADAGRRMFVHVHVHWIG